MNTQMYWIKNYYGHKVLVECFKYFIIVNQEHSTTLGRDHVTTDFTVPSERPLLPDFWPETSYFSSNYSELSSVRFVLFMYRLLTGLFVFRTYCSYVKWG